MLQRRQLLLGLGALPLLAAGCAQTRITPINAPDFRHLPKLHLAVGTVLVEPLHNNREVYPHIEGLSPYPLQTIIRQWSDEVFVPAGGLGTLNIQILTASLSEEKLEIISGLQGMFRNDQSEAYHGHIELAFQASLADFSGTISVQSMATRTVSEKITLRERQQTWVDLGVKMVKEIDQKLRNNLQEELPRLLLTQ